MSKKSEHIQTIVNAYIDIKIEKLKLEISKLETLKKCVHDMKFIGGLDHREQSYYQCTKCNYVVDNLPE